MSDLRFALFGAGFWAKFQLAAWKEVEGAQCVAICDPIREKAQKLADELYQGKPNVPNVYDGPKTLLSSEQLDFVDIVAAIESHVELAKLAAEAGLPAICQKPLAESFAEAQQMRETARSAGTKLFVHENWRWQAPMRRLKEIIDSGRLGVLVRAKIDFASSFPVFDNQPTLKELEQFIIADTGTHILDAARFLFGEAADVTCHTRQTRDDIAGEDVATVMMRMKNDMTVMCSMGYASCWEHDVFPQTIVTIEGKTAGLSLHKDGEVVVYEKDGQTSETVPAEYYAWADPDYALVHSSIVNCHRNILSELRGEGVAETTVDDNLKTLELVDASYRSAASRSTVEVQG